jgi:hypothetical protein
MWRSFLRRRHLQTTAFDVHSLNRLDCATISPVASLFFLKLPILGFLRAARVGGG